jgi:hypothetical protein
MEGSLRAENHVNPPLSSPHCSTPLPPSLSVRSSPFHLSLTLAQAHTQIHAHTLSPLLILYHTLFLDQTVTQSMFAACCDRLVLLEAELMELKATVAATAATTAAVAVFGKLVEAL